MSEIQELIESAEAKCSSHTKQVIVTFRFPYDSNRGRLRTVQTKLCLNCFNELEPRVRNRGGIVHRVVTIESVEELCIWCKKNPRMENSTLCEDCYEANEKDASLGNGEYRFICPVCKRDLQGRLVCPECGIIRLSVLTVPRHCHVCHCRFFYEDKFGVTRCWCCNSEWRESEIDRIIMEHIRKYFR